MSGDEHKFVFIGGLHKSGTSLFHRILRDHPQISGFHETHAPQDEGQHLQDIYLPARDYGGMGRFGFHPRSALDENSPLASPESAARLLEQWGRFWDLEKPVLVEKSPPNLTKTRFLQALFPGAYFIILLRHPIPVSYATQSRSHTALHSLVRHWTVCHRRFQADRPHLQRVLVLKYEQFVASPQETFEGVYDFLGLAPVPPGRQVRGDLNEKYFDRWRGARRRPLQRLYTDYIALRHERAVNPFGYSLKDLARNAPFSNRSDSH